MQSTTVFTPIPATSPLKLLQGLKLSAVYVIKLKLDLQGCYTKQSICIAWRRLRPNSLNLFEKR